MARFPCEMPTQTITSALRRACSWFIKELLLERLRIEQGEPFSTFPHNREKCAAIAPPPIVNMPHFCADWAFVLAQPGRGNHGCDDMIERNETAGQPLSPEEVAKVLL